MASQTFTISNYLSSGFKNIGRDAASIKAAAQAILNGWKGLGNEKPVGWAKTALKIIAKIEAGGTWQGQKGDAALKIAYDWITGAKQPTAAKHVLARAQESLAATKQKIANFAANKANVLDFSNPNLTTAQKAALTKRAQAIQAEAQKWINIGTSWGIDTTAAQQVFKTVSGYIPQSDVAATNANGAVPGGPAPAATTTSAPRTLDALKPGEPTVIDPVTFQIRGTTSGTVYGTGTSLADALTRQQAIQSDQQKNAPETLIAPKREQFVDDVSYQSALQKFNQTGSWATTTPTAPTAPNSASTPPPGATKILSPTELSGLTESQIWRDPNSSAIYRLPAPITASSAGVSATSSTTPPAGATLISNPADLSGLTESQIWRDPLSSKIYRLPTASVFQTNQPPAGATKISNPADLAGLSESQIWRDPNSSAIYLLPGSTPSSGTTRTLSDAEKQQLDSAYARIVAGTGNATDQTNLDYAYSRGLWTPGGLTAAGTTTAPAISSAGDQLTGVYKELFDAAKSYLDELKKRGEVVNADVQITPDKVAEFMKKAETNLDSFVPYAEKEILPYYQTALATAREGFLSNLGYSKEQILQTETDLERQYGQALRNESSAAAESGFALSGQRQRDELNLATDTQNAIDTNRRQLAYNSGEGARQFAQTYGTANTPSFSLAEAPRVLAGQSAFQTSSRENPLYQLSDATYRNLKGTSQYEQDAAIKSRAADLEAAFRANAALDQQRQLTV